jgi:hypothetical protein
VLCEVLEVGRRGFADDPQRQVALALSRQERDRLAPIKAISEKPEHR